MSNEPAENPLAPSNPELHHVGFVVASIEQSALSFAQSVGGSWNEKIIFDPIQKVRVSFLQGANGDHPMIELVEPGSPDSPVSGFLERGGGLHHLCYEVDDLESHLAFCKAVKNIVIRRPVPAVAFGGRRIAWAISRKRLLMEFLERKKKTG
jgi:methylmalonyl-CoA/ethylmalonyl-CoA epimerase